MKKINFILISILLLLFNCSLTQGLMESLGFSKKNKDDNLLLILGGLWALSNSNDAPKGCSIENKNLPSFKWSDPAAWGSEGKPTNGKVVTVPNDKRIILDENPPNLAGITVNGILEFENKDISLNTGWIMVHGLFRIGSIADPYTKKAFIQLTGSPSENVMGMGSRGIMVMGGCLEMHGRPPESAWTKISQTANSGSNTIQTINPSGWNVGDEIVIAPTDFYEAGPGGSSITQKTSIVQVNGANSINLANALNATRYGELQYPITTSPFLSTDMNHPNRILTPPSADTDIKKTPLQLDERAEVGNLTRNIVVESIDDSYWQDQGYGAHIMIMQNGAEAYLDGVEIRRAGQRGLLGRYPFHWHMLSYSGTQYLGDATGQYIKNSSVAHSSNRGIVIHGTNGVIVQNNIVYDVRGHGIFTEDAVERRNTIDNNLVLHIRNPSNASALKQHEVGTNGSSGFWISNPDNTVTNNVAADSGTFGFWLAFPEQPWGESQQVLAEDGIRMKPNRILFGTFDNNTSHSNRRDGLMLDEVEIDNLGNTRPEQYQSTSDGRDISWPYPTLRRFALSNFKAWKNRDNGIWDRGVWADNYGIVSADNCGRFFAGSGAGGVIEKSLVIGTSLNHMLNGTDRPAEADFQGFVSTSNPVAFATYHSTFDIKDNIVMNFPVTNNVRSGVFATEDYYIRPVDKGHSRNSNNLIINSHPGVKMPSPQNYFTFASALLDAQGIWGPAGNYFVYDVPFLTHGKTITTVAPSGGSGGVSVPGPFYGFVNFVLHGIGDTPPLNRPSMDLMGLNVDRYDNTGMNYIASWVVQPAQIQWAFQHMRDFAITNSGVYELTFPGEAIHPTNFQATVENMLTSDDTAVIGIQFDGSVNARVAMVANNAIQAYEQVGSREAVINSITGNVYYQDAAANRVWIKIRGGFWAVNPLSTVDPTADELLYEPTLLRIFPQGSNPLWN